MKHETCHTQFTGRPLILVSPIRTAPGRFQATLESTGEILVDSSRQPFVDAARIPAAPGCDPAAILGMKHEGGYIVALRGPLLKASRLSVEEGANGPRFVSFRKGLKSCVDTPPITSCIPGSPSTPAFDKRIGAPATQRIGDGGDDG
jgi:hypothetical protein